MDAIVFDFGSDPKIEGECQLENYDKQIQALSFSHGVSMPMAWDVSNTKRTVGKSSHQDLTFVKKYDIGSAKLNYYCAVGKEFALVKMILLQADDAGSLKVIGEVHLTNTIISSISTSGGGGDVPIETLSLNFSKIKWVYNKQNEKGAQEGSSAYEFDLKLAKGQAAS